VQRYITLDVTANDLDRKSCSNIPQHLTPPRRRTSTDMTVSISSAPSDNKTIADGIMTVTSPRE